MTDLILHTRDLAVGYDGKAVVKGLTFSLRPGEILTLIGPNGAGKSTILKTLARRLEPVAGAVLLDGKALSSMAENELAKRLSIVTTERVRAELMSCREVVATGRYPYTGLLGILSEHDRAVVSEAMALTHVTELQDMRFDRISDGQRQRVMLARALAESARARKTDRGRGKPARARLRSARVGRRALRPRRRGRPRRQAGGDLHRRLYRSALRHGAGKL